MRGFLEKLHNGMARFMYGRNGADHLNHAIFILYLAALVVQTVAAALTVNMAVANFFSALSFALALVYIFRAFSRNLERRRTENAHFLGWWQPKQAALQSWNYRRRDKAHAYIKCRCCGAWCRVPRGKGRIELTCPRCRAKTLAKT